ncbi:MAG: glycosyltransferase family 39 protein [Anaerolineae bacterium]|jgi:4-amino-4-deoxy-L-arabinose transferase-like glycosyltransferase|nr:glycosyltransferase family 39 protein [Anaerolineae bacterium]MDH7475387.1 glycosyltransferase family 39 protein [Anaerolineae bacterium]
MGEVTENAGSRVRRLEIVVLVVILVVAAFFRMHRLDCVPPGLTHDEAANGHDAAWVLRGGRPLYFATNYGHEPLYCYLVAGVSALNGGNVNEITLRLTTVLCGLGVILGTYILVRRMFGVLVALTTVAGLAISFWPVFTSRQGVRPVTLPLLLVPAAYCLWRGLESLSGQRSRVWLVVGGVLAGASFYTYVAVRVMPLFFLVFTLYLAMFHRARLSDRWPAFVLFFVLMIVVAAPLFVYLHTHPGAESRISNLDDPLRALAQGDLRPLLSNALSGLGIFSFRGDSQWRYNLPGRPIFDPLTALFFYGGLALALWRWREPRYALLLGWFAVGMVPGLATGAEHSIPRLVAMQPVVYLLVSLGMMELGKWLWRRGRWLRWATAIGLALLLVWNGWLTLHDYFLVWASEPDVREVYHTNLREIARYLDAQPDQGPVVVSTEYPTFWHDPYIFETVLRRQDLDVRWCDGRGGLLFPATDGDVRYVFSASADLDTALGEDLWPEATLIAEQRLRSDDLNPWFRIYRWAGLADLAGRIAALAEASPVWVSGEVSFADNPLPGVRQELPLPVKFNNQVKLLAYRLNDTRFAPGDVVELVTYWQAEGNFRQDLVIFVHLLDAQSQERGGQDVLNVPATTWQAGDVIIQVHRFTVAANATTGPHYLELGWYDRATLTRLPVLANGEAIADRLLLHPLEIK